MRGHARLVDPRPQRLLRAVQQRLHLGRPHGAADVTFQDLHLHADAARTLPPADGEAAAYATVGPPSLPIEANGPAAELKQFYVRGPWHGSGAAAEMMNWVLEEARRRGAKEVFLSVFIDNLRARRFYERHGFIAAISCTRAGNVTWVFARATLTRPDSSG